MFYKKYKLILIVQKLIQTYTHFILIIFIFIGYSRTKKIQWK